MGRPQLEALAERISRGEPLTAEDVALGRTERPEAVVVRNLALIADISGFHHRLHGDPVDPVPRTAEVSLPSQPRWGRLEIRDSLGRGGFGKVHRAFDPGLEREVALKLFRTDLDAKGSASSQLLQEARLLAKVRHANIVTVHGVETHDDRPGYWMELVEGKDLEQHLREEGPRSAEEASHIGAVICRALAALHAIGLVHRDVKTTNVMRERGGRLVLMDFGTVVSTASIESGRASLSGTPAYMAPETLTGSAPSSASDIDSLGVMLFHLTTGAYPYQARSFEELKQRHRLGNRQRLRDLRADLPPSFCDVVETALDPDPSHRFRSVGEMEAALVGSPRPAARPSRSRRRWLAGAALGLGLLAASFAVFAPSKAPLESAMVVDARLYTLVDERPSALGDQSAVAVGSPLWLELRSSRDAFVYVLDRDRTGQVNLLFPLPEYDTQNPLSPNQTYDLPGRKDGVRKGWRVSSEGGREEILIVASAQRLTSFERSLAQVPAAGEEVSPTLALGAAQMSELVRGVSETMDLPDRASTSSAAADVFAAAEGLSVATGGDDVIWIRKVTLENP